MTGVNDDKNDYLYRYQPLHRKDKANNNIVENLEIFSKKELFFVSPPDFNDPFDCKAFLTYKNCTIKDLFNYILWQLRRLPNRQTAMDEEMRNEAFGALCKVIEDEIFNGSSDLSESMKKHKENFLEDVKGDAKQGKLGIGILSLSEKNDDILMWGHYSDGHKGYCLEFDQERLEKWARSIVVAGISGKLACIDYNDAYPNIADYMKCAAQGQGTDLDQLFLLRKSSHWGYEKEWRIIINIDWQKVNPQIHSFREDMLTGVIFGCEMSDEHKEKIMGHLDLWTVKPKIYGADKSENQYAVEIKEMD